MSNEQREKSDEQQVTAKSNEWREFRCQVSGVGCREAVRGALCSQLLPASVGRWEGGELFFALALFMKMDYIFMNLNQ